MALSSGALRSGAGADSSMSCTTCASVRRPLRVYPGRLLTVRPHCVCRLRCSAPFVTRGHAHSDADACARASAHTQGARMHTQACRRAGTMQRADATRPRKAGSRAAAAASSRRVAPAARPRAQGRVRGKTLVLRATPPAALRRTGSTPPSRPHATDAGRHPCGRCHAGALPSAQRGPRSSAGQRLGGWRAQPRGAKTRCHGARDSAAAPAGRAAAHAWRSLHRLPSHVHVLRSPWCAPPAPTCPASSWLPQKGVSVSTGKTSTN